VLAALPALSAVPNTAQAGAPTAAQAGPVVNIAILDFRPNNVSAGDAAVVSDFVRSAFVKSGVYIVVDKAGMEQLLAEQAFQQTGCTDSDCAVKLGKLLNVQKMVVGNYSMAGSVRFLTASLVDVETGRIERTGKVKGFEAGNIDEVADDVARQLTGGAAETRADEAARRKAQAAEEKARLKAEREAEEASRPADSRVTRGRIGVGLNFPGLGLRALVGNSWMIEGWGQYEKEGQAYGGRLYLYVFPGSRVYPYLGAGGGYARYQGEGLNADGYLGEAFAGLEYFLWRKLSLQFDFGPAQVGLKEGAVSATGIRFVVNFGLTVYF